jgi:hypothetical protein
MTNEQCATALRESKARSDAIMREAAVISKEFSSTMARIRSLL